MPGRRKRCAPSSAWCRCIGRLALSAGILAVAGLPAGSAGIFGRETVFLFGLIVPAISVAGVLLIRAETSERRPIDWRILGGGIAFGAAILALALGPCRSARN